MYRVITVDEHGGILTEERTDDGAAAAITYIHTVLDNREAHVRLVEGDELPGLPENVLAQRFGNPCENPCCVPLADHWPEATAAVTYVTANRRESERGND